MIRVKLFEWTEKMAVVWHDKKSNKHKGILKENAKECTKGNSTAPLAFRRYQKLFHSSESMMLVLVICASYLC